MKNTWTKDNFYYVSLVNKSNREIKSIIATMGDNASYVHDAKGNLVAMKRPIITRNDK